ncbi:MAG: glycosyltransferase [Candidatus Phytoplasma sp.]|nr:glycosyltransferase [Phytoplasma sp.]
MISIIVPVYNVQKYLEQCIESVICQPANKFELILINDGSTDNSGAICDRYSKKDNRIKVIHKENGGVSTARNEGLKVANGEYVWFLDSDDYMVDSAIVCVLGFIKKLHYPDLITCAHYNNFSDGKIELSSLPFNTSIENINSHEYYKNLYLSNGAYWAPWKNIYKNSVIQTNNLMFLEGVICSEDCDFFMRYIKQSNTFAFLNSPTINYRIDRDGSVTNVMSVHAIKDRLNIYRKYYEDFINNGDDISSKMGVFFANKFANAVYDLWRLKNPRDKTDLIKFIERHKVILNETKGFKYSLSRVIWAIFGYYRGSVLLKKINRSVDKISKVVN